MTLNFCFHLLNAGVTDMCLSVQEVLHTHMHTPQYLTLCLLSGYASLEEGCCRLG